MELAARFRDTGTTVYVLAGPSRSVQREALAALEQLAKKVDIAELYSTLVYTLTF